MQDTIPKLFFNLNVYTVNISVHMKVSLGGSERPSKIRVIKHIAYLTKKQCQHRKSLYFAGCRTALPDRVVMASCLWLIAAVAGQLGIVSGESGAAASDLAGLRGTGSSGNAGLGVGCKVGTVWGRCSGFSPVTLCCSGGAVCSGCLTCGGAANRMWVLLRRAVPCGVTIVNDLGAGLQSVTWPYFHGWPHIIGGGLK